MRGSPRPGRRDRRAARMRLPFRAHARSPTAREHPARPRGWRRARRAPRSKPSRSVVSRPMRTFFNDVTSGLQMSSKRSVWSSAASIAASKRGPVSMTIASYALRAASSTAASTAWPTTSASSGRRGAGSTASPERGSMLTKAASLSASMSPAEAARSAIVARGVTAERQCRVAELQIEVDEERSHSGARGRDREVRGEHCLAASALGREDGDDLAGSGAGRGDAPPSGARTAASPSAAAERARRPLRLRGRFRRSRSARRRRQGSAERRRARPPAGHRRGCPVPTTTRRRVARRPRSTVTRRRPRRAG